MALELRDDTPVNVEGFLDGAAYPATREDLVRVAWDNHAPREVMELLERLSDVEEFGGPRDVTKAYEEVRIAESERRELSSRLEAPLSKPSRSISREGRR
jgi:hypothetical protein